MTSALPLAYDVTPPVVAGGLPDLLLVHGLFDSRRSWSGVAPHLVGQGFKVVRVDQRGHGDSPKPPSGYTPQHYVADLQALLNTLELHHPVVVGHSMGARVGYFLAAMDSSLKGLVLGDIGMEAQATSYLDVQRLVDMLPEAFESGVEADEWVSAHLPEADQAYYRRCLTDTSPLRWQFSFPAVVETVRFGRAEDWIALAARIRCPVLFIRGSESTEVSAMEARRVCESLSRCTFVQIEGAGHDVHESHPVQFAEAVRTWVHQEVARTS